MQCPHTVQQLFQEDWRGIVFGFSPSLIDLSHQGQGLYFPGIGCKGVLVLCFVSQLCLHSQQLGYELLGPQSTQNALRLGGVNFLVRTFLPSV